MGTRLNPYVSFDGTARQAMEFYRDVFGGELVLSTFGEFGAADQPGADKIMHAQLETSDGFTLMASDTPPGTDYRPGSTMSISLSGDDGDRLRRFWERLSDGGTITMPLEKQVWGDEFGSCTDQYGISWLVNISQPAAG
jgi:PhnB protein